MRTVLFSVLILVAIEARGQTAPRSTFAVKGQEWQYQNFYPKFGFQGKTTGFFEVTSFDYKVISVRDSAGITYSTISKTGTAANMDDAQWHREFVVRSDDQYLVVPPDYYIIDTIFICDKYEKMKKKKVWVTLHADGDSIRYPAVADSNAELPLTTRNYGNRRSDPYEASLKHDLGFGYQNLHTSKGKLIETSRKILGTKKVRTPAGEFTCLHIQVHLEIDDSRNSTTVDEYYCPGIGIVRTDEAHGTYMILSRIKKKS
jgi:uncharacterized protein DUF3108